MGLMVAVALGAAGCDGGSEVGQVSGPDTVTPDELTTPIQAIPVEATVKFPPVTVEVPPQPTLPAGETDGSAILFTAEDLQVRRLYGMGADPDGIIGSIGGGSAGILPLRVKVRLAEDEGVAEIRLLDGDSGRPILEPDGLVESYPYTTLDDGRVRVDFASPTSAPGFSFYGSCTYELADYTLAQAPLYADGLVTWAGDEVYRRRNCPNWAPATAEGVNVHFLRHPDAGATYTPREADFTQPFGFFMTAVPDDPTAAHLARLGGIYPGAPEGGVVYYLSPSFPEVYAGAAQHVFDTWNDALEDATGMRPFRMERGTADMIPWDPRFHVVLWRETGSGGAVAPFAQDPDTGEIVQSFVVMWFGELDDLVSRYHDFFDDHPDLADMVLDEVPAPAPPRERLGRRMAIELGPSTAPPRYLRHQPFNHRPLRGAEIQQAWARLGRDASDEEVTNAIVADFLIHELGHNLGLRHNFIGSADWGHADPGASSSTTMDYVIGLTHPGSYDRDAMRYGYGEGAEDPTFLYCTDEDLEVEPACVQWDFGNPIRYTTDQIERIIEKNPPETSTNEITRTAEEQDWASVFLRFRALTNTVWEGLDPADPVDGFNILLDKVVCAVDGGCPVHVWVRSQLALQLLYTRHAVQFWWEPGAPTNWLDLPALDETQAATLMSTYFDLVTDGAQPQSLRLTIVDKLPTAAVPGADQLLSDLDAYYDALENPSSDDQAVSAAVSSALGQ